MCMPPEKKKNPATQQLILQDAVTRESNTERATKQKHALLC